MAEFSRSYYVMGTLTPEQWAEQAYEYSKERNHDAFIAIRDGIVHEFGEDAYRDAMKSYWRNHKPEAPGGGRRVLKRRSKSRSTRRRHKHNSSKRRKPQRKSRSRKTTRRRKTRRR